MQQEVRELDLDESEIEHFANNRVWKQIAEDIMTTALMASEDNDTLDPITEAVIIARNQGKIEAIKRIVDMPRVYTEEIKLDKQTKTKEEKEK